MECYFWPETDSLYSWVINRIFWGNIWWYSLCMCLMTSSDNELFVSFWLVANHYRKTVCTLWYQNCLNLRGNIIWTVLYWQRATSSMGTVNKNSSHSPVGPWVCLCMIYLYVGVCFVLPWTVESFPFMFWRWRNKLKTAPFELFAPSSLLWVRSWLHPCKSHCEQKAMRDEGVIYVAGHPLLNRRCTRLPGCFCFPKRKL